MIKGITILLQSIENEDHEMTKIVQVVELTPNFGIFTLS